MSAPSTHVWVTAPPAWEGWEQRVADLDPTERARLAGLTHPETARAYAAAHLLARDVLGEMLGADPAAVAVDRLCDRCGAQHGPPVLAGHAGVHLSLSRTVGLVAVAVSTVGRVGVDVELVAATDFAGFDAVATHPADRPAARTGGRSVDRLGRARSWVRKEAALKALGVGLRADPATVREPVPGEVAAVLPGHPPVVVTDLDLTAAPESLGHVAALGLVVGHGRRRRLHARALEVVVHPR